MQPERIARLRMRAQRVWGTHLETPHDALRWLTAAQAQEFAYAKWSLAQRTKRPRRSAVERAFDDGRILRTHVLRPTLHFVAPEDLRWLMRLSGPRVNAVNARRSEELGLDARTLAKSNDVIAEAVRSTHLTRREIAAILARKRISTEGQRIPYLIMRAELDAVICSGAMKGNQHTYAAFDERVPVGPAPQGDEALAELARRFFTARGPATLKDFAWWSGFPMGEARRGLHIVQSGLEHRIAGDRTYWFAEARDAKSAPKIDLVQCFDEVIISYSESRDVLQTPSARFAVPRNIDGYAHVILCDGRLLGHWRATRERDRFEVQTRIGKMSGAAEAAALDAAIHRYRWYAIE